MVGCFKLVACDPKTDPDFIRLKVFLLWHADLSPDPRTGIRQYSAMANGMPDTSSPTGPMPITALSGVWERLVEKGLKFEKTFATITSGTCFKLVECEPEDPDYQTLQIFILQHTELPPDPDTLTPRFSAELNGHPELSSGLVPHAQYALVQLVQRIVEAGLTGLQL